MFGNLIKKKLDANRLANIFVNSIMEATESGFKDIASLISEDSAFIEPPQIKDGMSDSFLLIVVVGNLRFLEEHFDKDEAVEIEHLVIQKLAVIYNMEPEDFKELTVQYDKFISRVNHPSKNTLYGMSKAVFHKFNLNDFQESYFKSMKTPNPLFLKRMDEIMMNFLWDWNEFFRKYKLNLN